MINIHIFSALTDEHPKAREAREKAAVRAAEREEIKRAIATHNIHFHSVGDYTFCYRVDKRNVIEVASAIRNPSDHNDRHEGRVVALQRFAASNRMLMRVPSHYGNNIRAFLDYTFTEI